MLSMKLKEFRGNGAATAALREVTKKLHNPVLEIDINNMASKRVALKAGYALVEKDHKWEIYKF